MTEPAWLSKALNLAVHDEQLAEHGGGTGVRDDGLLESALARPQNRLAYDTKADLPALAAAYAFGLARNHPFVDGNKRTAAVICEAFLALNQATLQAEDLELFPVYVALAEGKLTESEFAAWLRPRLRLSSANDVHEPPARYEFASLTADLADLQAFLRSRPVGEPTWFVGLGSNLLVRDRGLRGTVVLTHRGLRGFETDVARREIAERRVLEQRVADRGRRASSDLHRGRVASLRHLAEQAKRLSARGFRGPRLPVATDGEASDSARGAVLDHVRPRAARRHLHPEAGQLAVPREQLPLAGPEPVHRVGEIRDRGGDVTLRRREAGQQLRPGGFFGFRFRVEFERAFLQRENFHGLRLGIYNPVLPHARLFVETLFFKTVAAPTAFRDDFHRQVRRGVKQRIESARWRN